MEQPPADKLGCICLCISFILYTVGAPLSANRTKLRLLDFFEHLLQTYQSSEPAGQWECCFNIREKRKSNRRRIDCHPEALTTPVPINRWILSSIQKRLRPIRYHMSKKEICKTNTHIHTQRRTHTRDSRSPTHKRATREGQAEHECCSLAWSVRQAKTHACRACDIGSKMCCA